MPYGSGLSAQLMLAAESTWATAVTVTTGYEMLSEQFQYNPTYLDGLGLKSGQAYKRGSRTALSRFSADGEIGTLEHGDQGHFGLLWKHALGSTITTPTNIATTAYKQIHTPGTKAGFGLTVQYGEPQTSGPTVQPYTYNGVKVTQWDFSCNDNQWAQLKLTGTAQNETTATGLAAASYTSGVGLFSFADCSVFTLGGTASTAAGETTVATGVSVTSIIKGITITGATPMAEDRFGLGNAGAKKEPIENAIPTITGHLDAEFTSRTEIYDLFKANTATVLQVDFSHGDAGSSNPYRLSFIFPQIRFKNADVNIQGPDILALGADFEAYDDGSGTNPVLQVKLVSKDTTL